MINRSASSLAVFGIVCAWAIALHAQTPPNVKLNTDASPFLQNEEQVWINLTDSLNVMADWRDFRLGFRRVGMGRSTDGGATWSDMLVDPMIFFWQSDPLMVGDNSGRFFMNMLDFDPNASSASHIVCYTSTNGGLSWTGPVPIQPLGPYFEDKQFSTVDRTGGPYDGNYYCSWTRFPDVGRNRMMLVRSTDGGVTFDDTVVVGRALVSTKCGTWDQGQFSIPIVNSDGSVHVFWQGVHLDSTGGTCQGVFDAIRHNVSFDGGATFVGDQAVWQPNLTYDVVDGNLNVYGMPNGDADISGGPYDGNIYISETQYANAQTSETDVQVRKSTDNGVSWSGPAVVNDDTPGQDIDQFHPWLYVNEDGVISLIFYDQRNDPVNHFLFDCYYTASFDGGETYITNYRLSSVSSSPSNIASAQGSRPIPERGAPLTPLATGAAMAGAIGEYICTHSRHDYNVAVWTDTRNGTQDVYSARFVTPFQRPRLYDPPDGFATSDSNVACRWSTCWHETQDSYRLEVSPDPTFTTGVMYFPGLTDNTHTPGPLATGVYYWRVKGFRQAGDSTGYSLVRHFTAACQAPAAPALIAPATGDTLADSSIILSWSAISGVLFRVQLALDPGFSTPILDTTLSANSLGVTGLSQDSAHYYWRVSATDSCDTGPWSASDFHIIFCPIQLTGDLNVSGSITSADIIVLVNYVFKSGPPPQPVPESGDIDCSSMINAADIIKLVNFTFKSGAAPCDACVLL